MLEFIGNGAPFSFVLFACCGLAFPLGLFALGASFMHRRLGTGLGIATVLLGVCQMLVGGIGWVFLRNQLDQALVYATPDAVDMLREHGEEAALAPLWMGLGLGALTLLAGVAAIAIAVVVGGRKESATG